MSGFFLNRFILLTARVMAFFMASSLAALGGSAPQESARPPLWGIAKITMRTADFGLVRDYYGRILGFSQAFSYQDGTEKVLSFKVSDRQFLEFIPSGMLEIRKQHRYPLPINGLMDHSKAT